VQILSTVKMKNVANGMVMKYTTSPGLMHVWPLGMSVSLPCFKATMR
jgi:hypothetical protein